eukprot:g23602.t1
MLRLIHDGNNLFAAALAYRIKDLVVKEVVKEQKGFGKFEKLKAYAEAIQEKWDLPKIKQYVLYGILLSDLAIFLLIYCLVLLIALPLHGYARAARLAWFQAVSNFTSLSIFEGLLLVGIHLLLHQVLLYSELLHSFVREILQIDLRELQIDVICSQPTREREDTSDKCLGKTM